MNRKLVGAGVAALGLAVASCGGSGTGPMTRAEFVRQASAICTHRERTFAAIIARSGGDLQRATRAALPEFERSVEQLGGLRPPAALRSAFAEILAVERHQVAVARQLLRTGRIPPRASEDGPPLHRHERMRAAMGMSGCDL